MTVRVTSASLSRGVLANLQANLSRMQNTQNQMSSGHRITKMSDSPVDAVAAMRLRAQQASNDQVGRNIDNGLSLLGQADSTFTSMSSMLTRVRQLVVSGRNETNTADERSAMADEVDELKKGLVQLANTTYLGRPIFAGTQNVSTAFDPTTGQYLGNGQAVQRSVSADGSATVGVTVTGDTAFSTLFSDGANPGILDRISAALRDPSGPDALDTELTNLDAASQTMQEARSIVGARYNQLLGLQTSSQATADTLTTKLSDVQDVDLAKTAIDLQIQQTAYQAALGASAKIIQPSLLDFLR